jgi:DNA primase large subunit
VIKVGSIVRREGGKSESRIGRVTGFAPNGWARVRVGEQNRIWPIEQLTNIMEGLEKANEERQAFLKTQDQDAWLREEIEKWIEKCGGWDKAKKICQLVWPENPAYR